MEIDYSKPKPEHESLFDGAPRNEPPLASPPIPRPRKRIEIRPTRYQTVLASGLLAFFGFLTTVNLYGLFNSRFATTNDIIVRGFILHGFLLAPVLIIFILIIRADRRSVRVLDADGVTRGDGRRFSWEDFCGTVERVGTSRFARRHVWRVELVFASGGTAWIIPQRIKNHAEVLGFVDSLPAAVSNN